MNQNTFGQPGPLGQPSPFGSSRFGGQDQTTPTPEPLEAEGSRKKMLVLGGAGLAAVVVAAGAALVLTGGDDGEQVQPTSVVAAPAPAAPAEDVATEAPAPLPTTVEFAGRNPFMAKVVEGESGTGGSGGSGPGGPGEEEAPEPTPVQTPEPVLVEGPPGPQGPRGERGPQGSAGETVLPFLVITYVGSADADDPASSVSRFIVDTGESEELDLPLEPGDDFGATEPLSWVRYLEVAEVEEGVATKVRVQLGDQTYVLSKDRSRTVYGTISQLLESNN